MISITLDEKNVVHECFPNAHITRTMRGDSKRHHYYVEETPGVMRLVRQLRGYPDTTRHKKRGRSSRKN